jgi:hypothetical protein
VPLDTLVRQHLATGSYQAALLPINVGPDPDVSAFWASPGAGGVLNFTGAPADTFFDADLTQGRLTSVRAVRQGLYGDAGIRFALLLPGLPLYSPVATWVTGARVRGLQPVTFSSGLPGDRFAGVTSWTVLKARVYPGETPPP